MSGQLMALNANWLNGCETSGGGVAGDSCYGSAGNYVPTNGTGLVFGGGTYYWPSQPWTYPVYVSSPSRPIKLTLSEIERLRKAARTDKALKSILAKFTEQIEITVDFD